jgi:hypothetical protein
MAETIEQRVYLMCPKCVEEGKMKEETDESYAQFAVSIATVDKKSYIHVECVKHKEEIASFPLDGVYLEGECCPDCGRNLEDQEEIHIH